MGIGRSKPSNPDPRVILGLRVAGLKRKYGRIISPRIGGCMPTFNLAQPYGKQDEEKVRKANQDLDDLVKQLG